MGGIVKAVCMGESASPRRMTLSIAVPEIMRAGDAEGRTRARFVGGANSLSTRFTIGLLLEAEEHALSIIKNRLHFRHGRDAFSNKNGFRGQNQIRKKKMARTVRMLITMTMTETPR